MTKTKNVRPWTATEIHRLKGLAKKKVGVKKIAKSLNRSAISTLVFVFGEGCAGLARRQTGRDHSLPPGPGRAAPPICSDLIYDRHTGQAQATQVQDSLQRRLGNLLHGGPSQGRQDDR